MKSILLCIMLSGCAVCEQHPTACKVTVVTASIVVAGLTLRHNETAINPHDKSIGTPNCTGRSCE